MEVPDSDAADAEMKTLSYRAMSVPPAPTCLYAYEEFDSDANCKAGTDVRTTSTAVAKNLVDAQNGIGGPFQQDFCQPEGPDSYSIVCT